MTRKALGRGLSALLTGTNERETEDLLEIEISSIFPSTEQPRANFNEDKLKELADSIKENGIVQPILVRRMSEGYYQIIAGERRWRAAQIAGLTKIPAVVRDVPDEKLLELALIENIQRQELNAIEEALAYKKLIDNFQLTQDVVAKRVGKDRTVITNHLRLLRLPEGIQKLLERGQLSMGHARALLGVDDKEAQTRIAEQIIEKNLSVREVEKIIGAMGERNVKHRRRKSVQSDPNFRAAEDKLRRKLGTQVKITQNQDGAGKIEIEYYSKKDLMRIYDILIGHSENGM